MNATVGIVGGVGPQAGLDLAMKIVANTMGDTDQDHVSFLLGSYPGIIGDRTEFLLGKSTVNPGLALASVLKLLADAGCSVAGIPCNTAHALPIFSLILEELKRESIAIKVLHMIEETVKHIAGIPNVRTVGVLSTTGTMKARIYPDALDPLGYNVITPCEATQFQVVHEAIYNREYGVKAQSNPVSAKAVRAFTCAVEELKQSGAEVVILGCTEIPLAITERVFLGLPMIDPTRILARALIREVAPEKLTPERPY